MRLYKVYGVWQVDAKVLQLVCRTTDSGKK